MISLRKPDANAAAVVATMLALMIVTLGVAAAEAAWKPVSPSSGQPRFVLVPADAGVAGAALSGSYAWVAPGDTVTFALMGAGPVRLKIRPLAEAAFAQETFRITVLTGMAAPRLMKRRAARDGEFLLRPRGGATVSPEPFALGEDDVLNLDWSGAAPLRVANRSADGALLVRLLAGDGVARRPSAAESARKLATPRGGFALTVEAPQVGYDDNAYLTPKNATGRESSWFLPVAAQLAWTRAVTRRTELAARYDFKGRFYDDPVLSERRHDLRAGGTMFLGPRARSRRWEVDVEYRFTIKNDTFNGRNDRDEFETIDIDAGVVSLANRFDYLAHRMRASVGKRLTRDVDVTLVGTGTWRDYVEDYTQHDGIYALDQSRLGVRLEASWRIRPEWRTTAEVGHEQRDYDEKFARDAAGSEVTTAVTSFAKRHLVVALRHGAGPGLRTDAEVKFYSSEDLHAGYWDYTGWALELGAGWRWSAGHRIEGSVRRSTTDYDNARVDHDPALPLRSKEILNLRLGAMYRITSSLDAKALYHYKDNDYNSPTFAYTRSEMIVGGEYRF